MVSLPCGSTVSLHDAARCWPIPRAEGGYGTSSPLSLGRNLSVPARGALCVPKDRCSYVPLAASQGPPGSAC